MAPLLADIINECRDELETTLDIEETKYVQGKIVSIREISETLEELIAEDEALLKNTFEEEE